MASKKTNRTKQETTDVSQSGFNTAELNSTDVERLASMIGGGALLFYCLRKVTLADALLVVAGGTLLYRGATGERKLLGSNLFGSININAAEGAKRLGEEIQDLADRAKDWAQRFRGQIEEKFRAQAEPLRIEKSIVINRSAEELYSFWRNFENLPRIMSNLESVTRIEGNRWHWVAKGPAGVPVEWDAEITADKKNEMIAWRAVEDADVPNQGAVYFIRGAEGQVELRVEMEYAPPGGQIGAAVAKFLGEDPEQKIDEDLNRFKEAVESGEITMEAKRYQSHRAEGSA